MELRKITKRRIRRITRWMKDFWRKDPDPTSGSNLYRKPGLRGESRSLLSCDVRTDVHRSGIISDRYCSDRSRTISYHFNSAGYRSEELDPSAEFVICVVGESNAVGTGVAFDSTFGQRFKFHYSAALGLPADSVNVINLAVFGASADYCARTIIRQLDAIRPHLVIVRFPLWDRIERYNAEKIASYSLRDLKLDKLDESPTDVLGFCHFYDENHGRMNTVKNALLLQSICQIRSIDYIFASKHLGSDTYRNLLANQLYVHLIQRNLCLYQMPSKKQDKGADGIHWGPGTHDAYAIALLKKFAALKSTPGNDVEWMSKASRIAIYASHLKM